jgi:hypothetical protein
MLQRLRGNEKVLEGQVTVTLSAGSIRALRLICC